MRARRMKRDAPAARRLARELAAARERAGLTQADLARKLETDVSTIWRVEHSERSLLVEELLAYARELGVRASTVVRAIENDSRK